MSYSSQSFGTPAQAKSITKTSTNNTGSTIPFCVPVKITSTGLATVNPALEADVLSLAGVTSSSVINTGLGTIVNNGTILNTGLPYSAGDAVFVSLSGGTTNVKPDIGVGGFASGDWVVRLGFMVKNEQTPSNLDLFVNVAIIGQL